MEAKHVIVGTSGHIDHGKTSLVRALTGTDTDRWEEERRRGITIDLGFASLEVEPGLNLGFIDVPGHERFVKNMLAGIGGIDLVVLVVAADESVMPQTREHFEICRLLGIRRGVIALTKSDLVDEEILELVHLEVEDFVAGSFLAEAPVIPVSSTTGDGLPELRDALAAAARATETRGTAGLLRLPMDRVFTMKGFGTVITGTLSAGTLQVDDQVEILPGGQLARIRNVEVHGQSVAVAAAGQRTAVNLGGVPKTNLERGATLVQPKHFATTSQLDTRIELLPSAKPLKHGAPVHLHLATAETVGRAYMLGAQGRQASVDPGSEAYVQLRLDNPVLAVAGDRFILRQFSPLTTIAGGTVLRPEAPKHRQKDEWRPLLDALLERDRSRILDLLCRERPYGLAGSELTALTGEEEPLWLVTAQETASLAVLRKKPVWVCSVARIGDAEAQLLEALERYHSANPLEAGAPVEAMRSGQFGDAPDIFAEHLLRRLQQSGKIRFDEDLVRLANHQIRLQADEQAARDRLVEAFQAAGLQVPGVKDLLASLSIDGPRAQRVLAALLREGVLVRVSHELVFHSTAIRTLKENLGAFRGQRINVAEFKALADVSRKYAIPLLEYFDRQKLTLRDGDKRRGL
ncbi:MAG: selenocysteine-specific translation elongation factor [Bryobacterales bacterium]|nr:selenocysteine-specific translation elongation factor [Bryobacterales bacterium]